MATLQDIQRRLQGTRKLRNVVKTMKSIAAVSIRQYERAVESLADYNEAVEMGLRVILRRGVQVSGKTRGTRPRRLAAVVFGSDQGMCGQFNEEIIRYALEGVKDIDDDADKRKLLVIGERVRAGLEAQNQKIDAFFMTPGSVEGVTPLVQDILLQIESWRSREGFDMAVLFHNRPKESSSYYPVRVRLLPMDQEKLEEISKRKWPSRSLPLFKMDPDALLSALVSQYLFVSLYRAMAESLAAENASRLASMQNAEKNIEDRIEDLESAYRHERQRSITEELLDIVSGFEALTD